MGQAAAWLFSRDICAVVVWTVEGAGGAIGLQSGVWWSLVAGWRGTASRMSSGGAVTVANASFANKVSVLMITYNHEKFIAQAIESVLMQVTDFSCELVIGEDCSFDSTRDIAKNYQERNQDIIRLLLREKNVGMNANFISGRESCKGEYIAR